VCILRSFRHEMPLEHPIRDNGPIARHLLNPDPCNGRPLFLRLQLRMQSDLRKAHPPEVLDRSCYLTTSRAFFVAFDFSSIISTILECSVIFTLLDAPIRRQAFAAVHKNSNSSWLTSESCGHYNPRRIASEISSVITLPVAGGFCTYR
jgi:hypothetical protein